MTTNTRQDVIGELLSLNITRLKAEISGSGDSGWVDQIIYYSGEDETTVTDQKIIDKTESFVFQCLDNIIPGFVNSDGGFGDVEWDVFADIITINGGTYYIETEHFAEVVL